MPIQLGIIETRNGESTHAGCRNRSLVCQRSRSPVRILERYPAPAGELSEPWTVALRRRRTPNRCGHLRNAVSLVGWRALARR